MYTNIMPTQSSTPSEAHGAIDQKHINRKTDYLFRISIKGLVRNDKGEILAVKERGRSWWDLPGGGMDHGENIKQALAREMYEEVRLTGDFTYGIITAEEPAFLRDVRVWQMRLVFEVKPVSMIFGIGDDGDAVAFINPEHLKNSDNHAERRMYEYARLLPG